MAANKGGLGRGLGALGLVDNTVGENSFGKALEVSVLDIDVNPEQPRKSFDDANIDELAASVKTHGIVQPVLVKKRGDRFLIVAGERRFRAAKKAGFDKIPVLLTDIDENEIAEVALIENIQRENLNPIDEAFAIKLLMEQHGLTQEEISRRLGKSRSAIANSVRLLDLSDSARERIRRGALSAGHGKMLAGIEQKKEQDSVAQRAEKEGWSVRQLEKYIRDSQKQAQKPPKGQKSLEIKDMERELSQKLNLRVIINGDEQRGRVELSYSNRDELSRLCETLHN